MFPDDYKNEMDKIKPDRFTKYKIRERIIKENEVKLHVKKFYFVKAVAAVLCIAVVFTAGTLFGKNIAKPQIESAEPLKTAEDYDKIYTTLSGFKPSIWDNFKNFANKGTDAIALYEEEVVAGTGKPSDSATVTTNDKETAGINDNNHSETTTQVEGVGEADIIKTDGKHIYIKSDTYGKKTIKIVEAGANPRQLSDIIINEDVYTNDMYLKDDRLVVLCGVNGKSEVLTLIYDISNPSLPKQLSSCKQSGNLTTSRLIGNKLYLISNLYVNVNKMVKSDTESYMPYIECDEFNSTVPPDTVHFYDDCNSPEFTVISAFNIKDSSLISTQSVLGGTETVYANTENIIAAGIIGNNKTQIARFSIMDGKIELKASAELNGSLLNQFSIDEYNNHFRFVLTETVRNTEDAVTKNNSTVSKTFQISSTVNSLVILDSDLKETGKIENIAPNERVYSVRFMGDTAYFVTFRQVDPLFSVDLSNPTNPKIIGSLKIPGFSNYLFPYGEGKLLGLGQDADENTGRTTGLKLSMFDISDPSNVTENDKTVLPAVYSEALYNHKAVLCDLNRNIIAFAASGVYDQNTFFVYSYENGKFIKKLETPLALNASYCRGIYIGKIFYIVTEYSVETYNIASFEKINYLELK